MSRNGLISHIRRLIEVEEQARSRIPSPFDQLRHQMDDVLGDGGILKEVVQAGEGPLVPQHASVLFHFSVFLEYSDQPFDTNTHMKYPRMLKLGRDITLAGLEIGLLTMQSGEFARFLFAPQYAYGTMGLPPIVPPAAVILYEVHMIDFLDSGKVDNFISLSLDEQHVTPLSTFLDNVNTLRRFGNRCFNQSRYDGARHRYKQAMRLLVKRLQGNNEEESQLKSALLPIYLNLSMTELHLDNPKKALKYGNKALEMDPNNTKALFRCGKAYMELLDYERAMDCLITAQGQKPYDSDINKLLKEAAMRHKDSLDKEKEMCFKMLRHTKDKGGV
ncbi:inactive peptidyl-prolyl cis-trans isomerase FKBP6 [Thalassophryne amazonica]|uniref:inactive peptidyl-prolyl cis-trans isomerase FKBP6 n=1 Tax=Thalassophryne amazonica TaxID=390379 RepID=UPI001471FCC3|nr:inactive peptidyl-prolyl cis-trans isomerase FKBP6 [Thalassophryne amazonica]